MATEQNQPAPADASVEATSAMHPDDAAWIARKSSTAPIVLGVLSILLSPILLGLFFGPLALRAGIDLRRQGVRGFGTVVAIAASLVGIVASVTTALLWGAVLAGVLLGRDAMRTAESWRGEQVQSAMVDARVASATMQVDLARPVPGAPRHAILVIGVGWEPCAEAIRTLAEAAVAYPDVPVIVLDRESSADKIEAFTRLHGGDVTARFLFVGPVETLPAPLGQAAALPTLVVVGADGTVEHAIVGAHPTSDIEKLLRGDAARPRPPVAGAR